MRGHDNAGRDLWPRSTLIGRRPVLKPPVPTRTEPIERARSREAKPHMIAATDTSTSMERNEP